MSKVTSILVSGGCGFIGANLVRHLEAHTEWLVRVVDDLRAGRRGYLDGCRAEVRTGDVADPRVLEPALDGVDAVVHLASATGVGPSVADPVADFEGNATTTFRTLESCRARAVPRFVFASSGAALGDIAGALSEDVVPRPRSPYGAGKLAGEAYCSAYSASFGMEAVALRFSNVYGPMSAHKRNAVPNFIKRCLRGEPIEIYGEGNQTRDFIYVGDLCKAIHRCLVTDGIGGEVYQLATGVETSVRRLVELVQQATGVKTDVRFGDPVPGEVYKTRVDISKARTALGFEPVTDLIDGLTRTSDWYRQRWLSE